MAAGVPKASDFGMPGENPFCEGYEPDAISERLEPEGGYDDYSRPGAWDGPDDVIPENVGAKAPRGGADGANRHISSAQFGVAPTSETLGVNDPLSTDTESFGHFAGDLAAGAEAL